MEECCCHKTKERTEEEYKHLIHRLNRIEGQIRGIRGMVEKSAYCTDILAQVAAANAALNAFSRAREKGFSVMMLMITDVLLEGSQIIYVGKDEIIQQAFNVSPKGNTVFLPHVMSRKKQIIPMLSALWG